MHIIVDSSGCTGYEAVSI